MPAIATSVLSMACIVCMRAIATSLCSAVHFVSKAFHDVPSLLDRDSRCPFISNAAYRPAPRKANNHPRQLSQQLGHDREGMEGFGAENDSA
jgi:hypothetical protein